MDISAGFGLATTVILTLWCSASVIATLIVGAALVASKGPDSRRPAPHHRPRPTMPADHTRPTAARPAAFAAVRAETHGGERAVSPRAARFAHSSRSGGQDHR